MRIPPNFTKFKDNFKNNDYNYSSISFYNNYKRERGSNPNFSPDKNSNENKNSYSSTYENTNINYLPEKNIDDVSKYIVPKISVNDTDIIY